MIFLKDLSPLLAAILLFPFGAAVGSFLNVVIYRLPEGESLLHPSRCPGCRAVIPLIFNIPILGWLLLRGRARCCGIGISRRYPLIELLTAAVWSLLTYQKVAPGLKTTEDPCLLLIQCSCFSVLLALSVIAIDRRPAPALLALLSTAALLAVSPFLPALHSNFSSSRLLAWLSPLTNLLPLPALLTDHLPAGFLSAACGALGGGLLMALLLLTSQVWRRFCGECEETEGQSWGGEVSRMILIGAFAGLPLAALTLFTGELLRITLSTRIFPGSGSKHPSPRAPFQTTVLFLLTLAG